MKISDSMKNFEEEKKIYLPNSSFFSFPRRYEVLLFSLKGGGRGRRIGPSKLCTTQCVSWDGTADESWWSRFLLSLMMNDKYR